MSATVTQLQSPNIDFAMSLEEEIILQSPHLSQDELFFHDAPEVAMQPNLSILDRLPASFQELYGHHLTHKYRRLTPI